MVAEAARLALATHDRIVAIAPHPDDDVLGCGALLCAAAGAGLPVAVTYVTDGARSHPHSKRFPAQRVRAIRECEALAALERCGIRPSAATFLRLPDGGCESLAPRAFASACESLARIFATCDPTIVLAPWRRDPHPDHRAVARLVREARALARSLARDGASAPRLLEYPVWLAERGAAHDDPRCDEAHEIVFAFDRELAARKRAALAMHRSQTTGLIDDDPMAFRLSETMLARVCDSPERYYEANDD